MYPLPRQLGFQSGEILAKYLAVHGFQFSVKFRILTMDCMCFCCTVTLCNCCRQKNGVYCQNSKKSFSHWSHCHC